MIFCYLCKQKIKNNMGHGIKRAIRITGKILIGIVIFACIAFAGLIIYAKYFYSPDNDSKSYFVTSLPLTKEQFVEDFTEIGEIVKDNYSLYEAKHLNIDSLNDVFRSRAANVSSSREYGELLTEYFASLQVAHSGALLEQYSAIADIAYINDSVFVNKPDSQLIAAGFMDKDNIVAVNGESLSEWMDKNERYVSASTPAYRRIFSARQIFKSLTDTVRTYTVRRGADTRNIRLSLTPHEFFLNMYYTDCDVLSDSVGYIAINTMMNGVVEHFASNYQKVKHLPYLIVDVRKNEGGDSANGKELCRYLIRKEQQHCIDKKMMTPRDDAYKGMIVILTSPITFSSAESFVIDMKESGNATLIGEPTAGDTGNRPQKFHTSHGIYFYIPTRAPAFSPKGFPLEGEGITPHHVVRQTVNDYLNDKDTQLEYALRFIIEKRVCHK